MCAFLCKAFVAIRKHGTAAVMCCAALARPALCCAVLCCAVLCCAVLCCAVLCCAAPVLCCAAPVPCVLRRWKKELQEKDVIVMTPELLLHCLSHASLKVDTALACCLGFALRTLRAWRSCLAPPLTIASCVQLLVPHITHTHAALVAQAVPMCHENFCLCICLSLCSSPRLVSLCLMKRTTALQTTLMLRSWKTSTTQLSFRTGRRLWG
jgi:hypothetical protein